MAEPSLNDQFAKFEDLYNDRAADIQQAERMILERQQKMRARAPGLLGSLSPNPRLQGEIKALELHIRTLKSEQTHFQRQMRSVQSYVQTQQNQAAASQAKAEQAAAKTQDANLALQEKAAVRDEQAAKAAAVMTDEEKLTQNSREVIKGVDDRMRQVLGGQDVAIPKSIPTTRIASPWFEEFIPGKNGAKPTVEVTFMPGGAPGVLPGSEAEKTNSSANTNRRKAFMDEISGLDIAQFLDAKKAPPSKDLPEGGFQATKKDGTLVYFPTEKYVELQAKHQAMERANADKGPEAAPGKFTLSMDAYQAYKKAAGELGDPRLKLQGATRPMAEYDPGMFSGAEIGKESGAPIPEAAALPRAFQPNRMERLVSVLPNLPGITPDQDLTRVIQPIRQVPFSPENPFSLNRDTSGAPRTPIGYAQVFDDGTTLPVVPAAELPGGIPSLGAPTLGISVPKTSQVSQLASLLARKGGMSPDEALVTANGLAKVNYDAQAGLAAGGIERVLADARAIKGTGGGALTNSLASGNSPESSPLPIGALNGSWLQKYYNFVSPGGIPASTFPDMMPNSMLPAVRPTAAPAAVPAMPPSAEKSIAAKVRDFLFPELTEEEKQHIKDTEEAIAKRAANMFSSDTRDAPVK